MSLRITQSLRDALAALYFKEECDQRGWAYFSLKQKDAAIAAGLKGTAAFQKGGRTINVRVPAIRAAELDKAGRSFDYLACNVGNRERYDDPVVASPLGMCWVKLGAARFSEAQLDALEKVSVPVAVYKIRDVLAPPRRVETRWEVRSGKEWLDMLDDQRDQAESDDDFL
jgi:hypothetical protein